MNRCSHVISLQSFLINFLELSMRTCKVDMQSAFWQYHVRDVRIVCACVCLCGCLKS